MKKTSDDDIKDVDQELMEAVSQLYGQLAQENKPLGVEPSKVLHDNLWDLYEE